MPKPKPKLTAVVILLATLYISGIFIQCKPLNVKDIPPKIEAVKKFLEKEDYANNPTWHLFPGTDLSPASDTLKRLGLPVHGRWVRTYVNDIAHEYLTEAIKPTAAQPLEFPVGSFIVKENYRSKFDVKTINARESELAVITLLYKPDPKFNYCVTPHLEPYNGEDCYGGEWFYGFYFLKEPPKTDLNKQVQANVNTFCVNCHAPGFNTDYVRTLDNIRNPFAQKSDTPYCDRFLTAASATGSMVDVDAGDLKQKTKQIHDYLTYPRLSPDLPVDVPIDPTWVFNALGPEAAQSMFNVYAWKSFIALNWPNKGLNPSTKLPQRGDPDKSLPFTANLNHSTVWETFKPTFEVFQPGDVDWDPADQPWNQKFPGLVGADCESEDHDFVITMGSKTRDVVNETGQAFAGTFGFLVDQDQEKVRYEVLFNRTEFEYLIGNGRAASVNLTPSGPKGEVNKVNFPDTRDDTSYHQGAMEIKSAWKKLCLDNTCNQRDALNLEAARKKFLVRKALVYDAETEACSIENMALVGLHVARKTYFAPQWIWMTFEHRDNVPDAGKISPKDTFTFHNPSLVESDSCSHLPFLFPFSPVAGCPNVDLNRFMKDLADQPNQLTRLVPIDQLTNKSNTAFQNELKKIGSPFANYVLVNTQWPLRGRNSEGSVNQFNCKDNGSGDDCFTMKPRFLRNAVIESFMSTYCEVNGEIEQFSNRSCMSCHGSAGADKSYVWLDAVSQRIKLQQEH